MQEKKIGIVGFGMMGKHLGRELRLATGGLAKVTAVVEPNDEKFQSGCEFVHPQRILPDDLKDLWPQL